MFRGHAVYGAQMVFDVVNQPSVFRRCLRNLTAVFGLHRKLTDDLLAFFLENQAVSISFYHIAPEGITDGCCYEKAAPFQKPTADNRLINRQKAIPYKGAGCGCRSIEDRPAPFFSSVNGKHSDDKQIERRCRLITKDRCREETNGSKGEMGSHHAIHKRIYQERSAHPVADGRRQEARPAYPVLQNYDQPGNQIDTEQFNRVPGKYGNRSQHMKHRIG